MNEFETQLKERLADLSPAEGKTYLTNLVPELEWWLDLCKRTLQDMVKNDPMPLSLYESEKWRLMDGRIQITEQNIATVKQYLEVMKAQT